LSFSTDDFAKALDQHDYNFQRGQVVRGKVFSHEADGAYVDIGGKAAAFLPLSEVSLKQIADLAAVLPLQEERDFLIVREQDAEGQITLSLRLLEIKRIWEELTQCQTDGETIPVKITGVNRGGVTVDVQGLRGFIPRSHLDERENLDLLIGKTLTVSFLEVDPDRRKLVLSQRLATRVSRLKRLEIGQLIDGTIVAIEPFGIFIDFNGTRGLLHIKQISKKYIDSLETLFEIGQSIKAVIIDLDEVKGRVAFSTKVLEKYPGEILEKMSEVMENAAERVEQLGEKLTQTE